MDVDGMELDEDTDVDGEPLEEGDFPPYGE